LEEKSNTYTQDLAIYTISFTWAKNRAICIPLEHPENKMDVKKCIEATRKILESNVKKIIHYAMFEYQRLEKRFDIRICNIWVDTLIMQHVINPDERKGLKYLSWKLLPYGGFDFISDDYGNEPLKDVAYYNMEDTNITFQLREVLDRQIIDSKMQWLIYNFMPKFVVTLCNIEKQGIVVDKKYLKEYKKQYEDKIEELKNELFSMEGVPKNFNDTSLNSPPQMRKLLFEIYKYPVIKLTDTRLPSTNAEVLEALSPKSKFCEKLLEYRKAKKVYSTYIKYICNNLIDGKIYTNINPTGTVTGRPSSNNLNTFNPPKDKEYRKLFIASKGNKLVSFDFSQNEVRILAMWTKDAVLMQFYEEDKDVHEEVGRYFANKPTGKLTEEERFYGKNAGTFPIIYGEKPSTTAKKLGIPLKEYLKLRDKFFELMPTVKKKIRKGINLARKLKYVRSFMGRIRYFDYENTFEKWMIEALDRQAINTPIQGDSSDLNSYAAVLLNDFIEENKFKSKIIMIIYDQLVLDCPEDEVNIIAENGKRIMEGLESEFNWINVPLKVDVSVGDNFGEL
jgi:DNA polymerase-1